MRQEVTLHSFTVDEESPLLNKSIAQSRLGKQYDSLIVAIEREDELISMNQSTVFRLGDLVWIVGEDQTTPDAEKACVSKERRKDKRFR